MLKADPRENPIKYKTMAEIILYLTKLDAESIVDWINAEDSLAWIVKHSQQGFTYHWKAIKKLDAVESKDYCLWKIDSGPLRIPSGNQTVKDTIVLDPFLGWEQTLKDNVSDVPWFGAGAPETFGFTFREVGSEEDNSIGRSGFNWIGNYFSIIGNGAPDECKKFWARLRRYVKKNSTGIPWPGELGTGKTGAYAFPEAYSQLIEGRSKDINPW